MTLTRDAISFILNVRTIPRSYSVFFYTDSEIRRLIPSQEDVIFFLIQYDFCMSEKRERVRGSWKSRREDFVLGIELPIFRLVSQSLSSPSYPQKKIENPQRCKPTATVHFTYLQPARRSRVLAAWPCRATAGCSRWSSASRDGSGCTALHPWERARLRSCSRRPPVASAAPRCVWRRLQGAASHATRPRRRLSERAKIRIAPINSRSP